MSYYEVNREKILLKQKEYYQRNKAYIKEKNKEYYRTKILDKEQRKVNHYTKKNINWKDFEQKRNYLREYRSNARKKKRS